MVKELLYYALEAMLGYRYTSDTLYFNDKPICSLNGLKQIRVSDEGLTLEFEDAGPVRLGKDGVVLGA
jgi:hypothetical protein